MQFINKWGLLHYVRDITKLHHYLYLVNCLELRFCLNRYHRNDQEEPHKNIQFVKE